MASFVILRTACTARIACSDRHTYIHTDRQTHETTTVTLSAHARRGLIIVSWKHWSANPRRNSHTAIYSINILSKYSSLISHRPSMFEGRHIDYRSSKVDTSITDLRRSTHRSSKVNTSISEGRHVTSIFESRHIYLRKSTHRRSKAETSHLQFVVGYCPQLRSYISSWSRPWINDRLSMSRRSYTRSYLMCVYKNK